MRMNVLLFLCHTGALVHIITIVTSDLQPRDPRPEADLRPLLHGDGAQVTLAGPGDQLPPHDVVTMRQILI